MLKMATQLQIIAAVLLTDNRHDQMAMSSAAASP